MIFVILGKKNNNQYFCLIKTNRTTSLKKRAVNKNAFYIFAPGHYFTTE